MAFDSKYRIDLVDKNGTLLAEMTNRARSRQIVQSRNQSDFITWMIDLNEFEAYCRLLNIDPRLVIVPGYTEVRVKRLGTYFSGGQINYAYPHLSATDQSIQIRASGFLDLFLKRYTGDSNYGTGGTVLETYTAANGNALSRQDLAWTLISQSQALTNGNYGITRGLTTGSATTYDKTYSRTNIKNALQDISNLQVGAIDFEFTYDKVFNCYTSIGTIRTDISLEYPGNIKDIGLPIDATNTTNEVIGLGQGDGITQSLVYATNPSSQLNYYLRQDVNITNGSDDSDGGVTNAADAELAAYGVPLKLPALVLDGNTAPYVTDYLVGDRVPVKVTGHPMFGDINGYYRIEKRTIDLDEDDNENITLEVSAT